MPAQQISIFSLLPHRCIDCVRFYRWDTSIKFRPRGWYRIDVGGCQITRKLVYTDGTCERWENAGMSFEDRWFMDKELSNDNFYEPDIQARLDEIAERCKA